MLTAKEICANIKSLEDKKFASVMERIAAIRCESDLDDKLSLDISNLSVPRQAQADAAIAAKASELGLV